MTELFVQYREQCLHSERASEPYGNWREEYDFSVLSASLTSRGQYDEEKFTVDFEVKAGEPVFILHITYSTGDSFGTAYGRGEVLWVFKDADLAVEALKRWKEESDTEFGIEFEVEGGKKIKLSNPAAGYFENLGCIELQTFLVNP
jgi:hypothetical protein